MNSKPVFPIRESFFFDAEMDEWFADENVSNIEILPDKDDISLIFPSKKNDSRQEESGKIVWCAKHLKYETWSRGASDNHCKLQRRHCVLNSAPKARTMIFATGVWRWLIIQESLEADLQIIAEWLSVKWEEKFIITRMSSVLIPYIEKVSQAGYKINLSQRTAFEIGLFVHKYKDKFPTNVAKRLRDIITQDLSAIFGHYVLLPQRIEKYGLYTRDLQRIVNCPNDVHISYLQSFLGKEFFDKNCRNEESNHYVALCDYLRISPPDSIRKEYLKDPYSIIVYLWLKRLGFQDINAIRLFFCDTIMRRTYFGGSYFDPEYRAIRGFSLPRTYCGADFVFYVRWMLKNGKGEMTLAKQIIKAVTDGWQRWHDDMLRMFHEYYPFLAEETKKIVKKRGLSSESHTALVYESYEVNLKRVTIDYKSPMIKNLNGFFDGLNFHVVTDTTELLVIGRHLSNCVASYASSVAYRHCLIVTASDSKDYQICMEILLEGKNEDGFVKKLRLVQCLGKYNKRLQGDLLMVCRRWIVQNRIIIDCKDI